MNSLKILIIVLVSIYLLGGIILYLFQDQLIFLPEPLDEDFEYSFANEFEEINLTMEDGAVINMLHFKVEESKGLIVYFHGNAGNLARWGQIIAQFVERGYEVLISDYRGYGKSTGNRSDKKLLSDAEEIYRFAKTLEHEQQITLFGRSLGSAFASYLAGKNEPKRVILETPFYSLKDVANNTIPIYPTSGLLRYSFKNHEYLQNVNSPVFIFHGTSDEVVPYSSGKRLYESLGIEAQLITIDSGHHNDLMNFDLYWISMEDIL